MNILERHTKKTGDNTYQAYLEYKLMGFALTRGLFGDTFAVRGGQGGHGDHCNEGYGCPDGAHPPFLCKTE